MRVVGFSFLFALSNLSAAVSPLYQPVNITFDQAYDVFYQQPFHQLFARVKDTVPLAYAHITKEWGLNYPGLLHPLTVQIKEIPSDTLRRWKAAYVESRGQGDSLRQFLVVDIGCYMQDPKEEIERIVTHEMAHVILQDIQAAPSSAPIPAWFNEGLAQSVTPEGRLRVENDKEELEDSGESLLLCDMDGPVDEFAHGPYNAKCYPEYYLAVQRLKQRGGPHVLSNILDGLQKGTPVPDLMPSLIGEDWPAFKKDVDGYTHDVFAGSKPIP